MSVDRKRRESFRRDTVLVHVGTHETGIQGQERLAADALELPVRRSRERARDGVALDVSHALHAAHRDHVVNAAGDCDIGHARGGSAGGARRFDRHGFDAGQTRIVRDQSAELLLIRENSR